MVGHFKRINWLDVVPFISLGALVFLLGIGSIGVVGGIVATLLLVASVMIAVYHAEEIAHSIGEGLGTLVLALSVTVIEVGLILTLMGSGGPGSEAVARDTVFSAVVLLLNGVVGVCLLMGGLKYREMGFQFKGTNTLVMVLFVVSFLCFVLPNFTTTVEGPYFNSTQMIVISALCILLYLTLVIFQTRTHTYYFQTVDAEAKHIPQEDAPKLPFRTLVIDSICLLVGLAAVIGLSKVISPMIESGVAYMNAPKSVVGLIIAAIVLLPEAITAVIAARENRLQTSLNLALGSGVASIALTIPVVSVYSIMKGQPLLLGLDGKGMAFLLLSIILAGFTLGNGKGNVLQGIVHLFVMVAYCAVMLIP